ncbi:hypothetical protein M3210_13675 [Oceanobacillus luteolus]|uniref:Uncharacterized protein n=1 Tax=Oceanobacillus luteolus TaxID=1274358 RepID=A0ABW4HWF5_9BACI|nr:hypothetical protein [Oceanobacillus luteolus]MCM3741320.1 hypothetical protein [Oceanobacillus luteolus]
MEVITIIAAMLAFLTALVNLKTAIINFKRKDHRSGAIVQLLSGKG